MLERGGVLQVKYKTKTLKKECTNAKVAIKKYGLPMAEKIHQRIDEISAAESVEEMIKYNVGRCHPLKGDLKDHFAVDLVHPQRMIFKKTGNEIQIAYIIVIGDYH